LNDPSERRLEKRRRSDLESRKCMQSFVPN